MLGSRWLPLLPEAAYAIGGHSGGSTPGCPPWLLHEPAKPSTFSSARSTWQIPPSSSPPAPSHSPGASSPPAPQLTHYHAAMKHNSIRLTMGMSLTILAERECAEPTLDTFIQFAYPYQQPLDYPRPTMCNVLFLEIQARES